MCLEHERELARAYDIICRKARCARIYVTEPVRFIAMKHEDGTTHSLRTAQGAALVFEVPAGEWHMMDELMHAKELSGHGKALLARRILDVCEHENISIASKSMLLPKGTTAEELIVSHDLEDASAYERS